MIYTHYSSNISFIYIAFVAMYICRNAQLWRESTEGQYPKGKVWNLSLNQIFNKRITSTQFLDTTMLNFIQISKKNSTDADAKNNFHKKKLHYEVQDFIKNIS